MSSTSAIATITDLQIRTTHGVLLVDGMSLHVSPGEAIAIVGESGSGKSMTARALTGLLPDGVTATGSIVIAGTEYVDAKESRWQQIRGRTVTWLPQDPFTMLSPLRRAGDSVRDGARSPLSQADLASRLAEVGIADPSVAQRYPFQLSGGLRQRVGLAAALAGDPDILIADEPSTALDVTTQRQVLRLLGRLRRSRGLALVLITHDLRVALSVADRVYVLYAGALLEVAAPADIDRQPAHPYTHGLLLAEPIVEYRAATLSGISGSVPRADDVTQECAFASRCGFVLAACRSARPPLRQLSQTQATACIRAHEIGDALSVRVRPGQAGAVATHARPVVLSATGICKRFGTVTALDSVSVVLREAEVVGIVGESGSGKTTLARIIAGLDKADAGTLQLEGGGKGAGRANAVQVIFQDPSATLNPSRRVGATLRDALRAGAQPCGVKDVVSLLAQVHLPASYASAKPGSLSGGERQRVAIARALAPRPRVLLCDEPVSSLDVSVQAQILELFRELSSRVGVAMLFITHDLGVVRQIADRIYVLQNGLLVEEGVTAELLDHPQHPYTHELIASVPRADPRWLDPPDHNAAEPNPMKGIRT